MPWICPLSPEKSGGKRAGAAVPPLLRRSKRHGFQRPPVFRLAPPSGIADSHFCDVAPEPGRCRPLRDDRNGTQSLEEPDRRSPPERWSPAWVCRIHVPHPAQRHSPHLPCFSLGFHPKPRPHPAQRRTKGIIVFPRPIARKSPSAGTTPFHTPAARSCAAFKNILQTGTMPREEFGAPPRARICIHIHQFCIILHFCRCIDAYRGI